MSGWVTFVLVIVGLFGQPQGAGRHLRWGWVAWAVVMLALITALLVDAKGWPS